MSAYSGNVRWLRYSNRKTGASRERVSQDTLRVAVIAIGAAAVAWGLMHLALRLLS